MEPHTSFIKSQAILDFVTWFLKEFVWRENHWAGRDFEKLSGVNYPGQMVVCARLVLPEHDRDGKEWIKMNTIGRRKQKLYIWNQGEKENSKLPLHPF